MRDDLLYICWHFLRFDFEIKSVCSIHHYLPPLLLLWLMVEKYQTIQGIQTIYSASPPWWFFVGSWYCQSFFPTATIVYTTTIWVWWRRWKKCTALLAITSNAQQFLPFRCHIVRMEQNHTCVSLNSTDSKIILYGENCSCKIMVKVSIWYANDDL